MTPKKKIYIVIFITPLVIMAFGLLRKKPSISEFKSKYFWTNKFESLVKHNVVIYGDSRTYRGVNPSLVIKNQNLSAFNYGFTSAGYNDSIYHFLDERISKKKEPIVLLGITPYSLTKEASQTKFYFQEKNRGEYDKFQRLYLDKHLTFFDRIKIEEYLFSNRLIVKQEFNIDGWVSSQRAFIDTLDGLNAYKNIFNNNQVSNNIINSLMAQVKKWTLQGVKVFGFRPPTCVSMENLENTKSGFNENKFIQQFVKNGGKWLEIDLNGYQTYDGSHLNKESADKLSDQLNQLIFN